MRWLLALCFALALPAIAYADDNALTSPFNGAAPVSGPYDKPAHQFLPWSYPAPGPGQQTGVIIPAPPATTCPNGTADPNDGCAGANANSPIKFANFWTSVAPQTGQAYFSANPESSATYVAQGNTAFNLPGVDYPVGPYTSRSSANDPQAAAISFTGSISGGVLTAPAAPSGLNFGQAITGSTATTVLPGTRIIAQLTSTTWSVTNSQTVASTTLQANNRPPWCTLNDPTGSYGDYGTLACGGSLYSPGYVWENTDFGPVNGHGPTFTQLGLNAAGTFTLQDWWLTNAVGSTTGICASPTLTNEYGLYISSGNAEQIIIQYGQHDGNHPTCDLSNTFGMRINTTTCATIQYNYFYDVEGLPVELNPGNTCTSYLQYNVVHNWYFGEWQSHAEITGMSGTTTPWPTVVVQYNTVWNDIGAGTSSNSTTDWYLSGGVNGANLNAVSVLKNATITNTVSGTLAIGNTSTIGFEMGNSASGGGGTGVGYYLTVESLSCPGTPCIVLPGMNVQAVSGAGDIDMELMLCVLNCTATGPGGISEGGVGSVWTTDCSVANSVCQNVGVASTKIPSCTIGSFGCYSISMGDFQVTSPLTTVLSDYRAVFGPLIEAAHIGFNQITINGNLFDATAAGRGYMQAIDYVAGPPWGAGAGNNGGCLNASILTGNIDLNTAAAANSWYSTSGNC